ncbi:MSCRAMM family protein [Culicoidibacter larvae]|uniref:SpaA-like prealbumin fold domain-containing protein n=1 Tax=Culicoidibacter larvae TaxID=2579976 RepID=A0A5R8Q805_9FIRM|nr:prealbumin-like fold domain-containing protein [Culicoidibacter larvae]TLG71271.1 hypothetical protein FEZ08_11010 [Culicoidibacter larvae]
MKKFIKITTTFIFVMLVATSTIHPVFATSENNQTLDNSVENTSTENNASTEIETIQSDESSTNENTSNQQLYSRHVTYQMGDYDILVPYNGVMTHPKDIEGFVYNDGQYPQYPKGWLNAVTEKLNADLQNSRSKGMLRSSVRMYEQIGYVDGNGYRTFINHLEVDNETAFCSQRAKDPASYSDNYSTPTASQNIKMNDALYIAFEDAYGLMGNSDFSYRFGIAQAAVWNTEGTLEYWAGVTIHGYGDVSSKYRQVIDKIEARWAGERSLDFTKKQLTSSFDPITKTITTESFKITDTSFKADATLSLPNGYYVTKVGENVALSKISKGNEYVIRTENLVANEQINLSSSITLDNPKANIFNPPVGYEELQAMIVFKMNDPRNITANLTADIAPAYIAVGGYKTTEDAEFKVLPGVTYGLYQADGRELDVVVTDENGKFLTGKVAASLYGSGAYLREIKTADDATYALDYQKFVLPDLSDPAVAAKIIDGVYYVNENQNIINEYNEIGDLTIAKVDSVTGEPLADAQFEVTRVSGEACPEETLTTDNNSSDNNVAASVDCQFTRVYTTDTTGYAVIPETDLTSYKYGEYQVKELVAPGGYTLSDEIVTFNIDSDQKIIHITFENDKIEELAVTGEGNFEALVGGLALIAITGGVILISRSKKGRKGTATLAIALLIGAGVFATSGTQVFATTTDNNEVEVIQEADTIQEASGIAKQFANRAAGDEDFINPLDPSVTVPTDPIPEVAPPPVEENIVAEGNNSGGESTGSTGSGNTSTSTSSEDEPLTWYDGPLTNTGQYTVVGLVVGALLAITGVIYFILKKKANKSDQV